MPGASAFPAPSRHRPEAVLTNEDAAAAAGAAHVSAAATTVTIAAAIAAIPVFLRTGGGECNDPPGVQA
ncbi:hypothetical protein GCM10011574_59910 [Microbispora bryophytorum]|uniref:Uncharacterized protein n=1 Tax=Microbispora bryophytorum TaxID=1460882 RepID=A0A8H9H4N1_9ACTN|nr:hypothetical protein GCM10011574_59910 [Microbispora bryophytorum]